MDYKKYLTDNVLKFWLDNSIDYGNGGIFTCLDQDGSIYGEEKSVWFQGRALWTFSRAYNQVEKKDEYLKAAKAIYDFLPRCTDSDGRMFFIVTKEGAPIQKRRYYFSETFAAIGCAEYYLATGNKDALNNAEKYFETAYRIFKDPSLTTPKLNTKNAPYKALSPVMIMLSTAQTMRSINKEKYAPIVTETLNEILCGGYLKSDVLLENVSTTGNFINTPTGRTVNPGHSLEASWFLFQEGIYRKDKKIIDTALNIVDFSMDRGYDNGGIIAFCDALGKPSTALEWDMKLWWPQCEAMIANQYAYNLSGNQKYSDNFKKLNDYAFSHFADNDHGEWYGYLHYDGTVANRLKGNIFKGPFHLPRMLMLLSEIS